MAKKLVNLLLAKSILETIFVGTLAVVVYTKLFPPTFHGWGEAVVEEKAIYGWVVNNARPDDRVEVEVYVDGRYSGRARADGPRPDIVAAGWSKDPFHGYAVWISKLPPGKHESRVYALHRSDDGRKCTLQLIGDPIQFEVDSHDNWKRR
ncbi:MAG TPA: hypothetical protein VKB05_17755 [Pyrinomonadaceae bacterium]|nr:hypothetical protein [Pyrinomonadaceae bacterium]